MSPEYTRALADHDKALARYKAALAKYRAMEIGDGDFLTAKSAYATATKIFDQAFAKEAVRGG